jgi:hypothetical protein
MNDCGRDGPGVEIAEVAESAADLDQEIADRVLERMEAGEDPDEIDVGAMLREIAGMDRVGDEGDSQ